MNLKIKEALTWGRIVSIFGFITSIFTMLSCVGIPAGILMLLGYIKLNNATDELKRISMKQEPATAEDYEEVIDIYGKYLKLLGISIIVSIAMSIVAMILYVLVFAAIFSASFGAYNGY
jgi:hypothetical protein